MTDHTNSFCWGIVDSTHEQGTLCENCMFYEVKEEAVPYGETYVGRTLYICNVVDPCSCPGVEEYEIEMAMFEAELERDQ